MHCENIGLYQMSLQYDLHSNKYDSNNWFINKKNGIATKLLSSTIEFTNFMWHWSWNIGKLVVNYQVITIHKNLFQLVYLETIGGGLYLWLDVLWLKWCWIGFFLKFQCTRCLQEISFKTDPKNTDYEIEAGATRNFMALKLAEEQAKREEEEQKEEEANNPMKLLGNNLKILPFQNNWILDDTCS